MTRLLTGLLALLITGGCGSSASPVTFSPTFDSKEAAAQAVLDALWTRDAERLRGLAVNETEFRKHIWPALPVAKADVGATPDYTWAEMSQKNAASLSGLLAEHGGRRAVVDQVAFRGSSTTYDGFATHAKTELTVSIDGQSDTMRLFGSMIESGGRWKIYSYIVD